MLLADAIETAIRANREVILMKRLNTVLFTLNIIEIIAFLFLFILNKLKSLFSLGSSILC